MFCTLSHGAVHLLNFHENRSNGINLQSGHAYMVETAIFIVQRPITPELGNPKLWLMRSVHHLIVLYIEATRLSKVLTDGWMDGRQMDGESKFQRV